MRRRKTDPSTLFAFVLPTKADNRPATLPSDRRDAINSIVTEARRRGLDVKTADTMTSVGKMATGPSNVEVPNGFPPGIHGHDTVRSQTNKPG
jgi:hypothetical protein